MPYADWYPTQGPSAFRDANGQAEARATGAQLDDQRERSQQAVLARFPTKGRLDTDPTSSTFGQLIMGPTDALDEIDLDRELQRASDEADAAYGPRLKDAWDFHVFGGSHYALLRQLQIAGYDTAIIVQDNGRWSRLTASSGTISDMTQGALMACINRSSHPGWTFDDRTDYWSRSALVFEADAANLSGASGQAILTSIANQWAPAETLYVGAFVILAGQCFGWPTGRTFGTEPNLGGNSIRTIPGDGSTAFVTGP